MNVTCLENNSTETLSLSQNPTIKDQSAFTTVEIEDSDELKLKISKDLLRKLIEKRYDDTIVEMLYPESTVVYLDKPLDEIFMNYEEIVAEDFEREVNVKFRAPKTIKQKVRIKSVTKHSPNSIF